MIMKKNIGIGAVLFILSICNLAAQEQPPVKEEAALSFQASFPHATNVNWKAIKSLYEVTFINEERFSIAFIDKGGKMITNGRKVNDIHALPVQVKNGLYTAKGRVEAKFGALSLGSIFEMIENGSTSYYVPMENNKVSVVYAISPDGSFVQKSKKIRNVEPRPSKQALARRN